MPIKNLQKIYECFGTDNISVCGGLVDYYWINYPQLWDFDLIINIEAIKRYFNISWPKIEINQSGFKMKRRSSSKFIEQFYQGTYLESKIDLFLIENFRSLDRDIITVSGNKFGINSSINIDSVPERIRILNKHLSYEINNSTEKWEKDWINLKKMKAKQKLEIYRLMYNEHSSP